ncbi:hypothetical protein CDD83_10200 [Cordyceps sp. RAO-2017]|nr:hypothetical protein CDD83_10200 [Cordyceps sp. RAO-2017]
MLDREAEKRLVREEACAAQLRRAARGGRPDARRRTIIPDFATTRFAPDGADDGPDQAARDAALALEAS